MFPFNGQDEFVFGNPNSTDYYQDSTYQVANHQDLVNMDDHDQHGFAPSATIINFASSSSTVVASNKTEKKRTGSVRPAGTTSDRDSERKKAVHREMERKRRQEMSQLYDSLRSLLPQEQLKGKQSISDLMNIAVDYTKSLEKDVEESRIRRDKLKKKQSTSSSSSKRIASSNNVPNNVMVSQLQYGIEILINTDSEFELSLVMIELLERELDVVSCVSTKSDDRMLHKILAQMNDTTSFIDVSLLQGRLTEVVNL